MQNLFPFVVEHEWKDLIQEKVAQCVWGCLLLWNAAKHITRRVEHKAGQIWKVQKVAGGDLGAMQPGSAIGERDGQVPG
jgi:hypothetical protein